MTPTDRLEKLHQAETAKRLVWREIALERKSSQLSGFILTFGEALDTWVPGAIASATARMLVRRRIRRRLERFESA